MHLIIEYLELSSEIIPKCQDINGLKLSLLGVNGNTEINVEGVKHVEEPSPDIISQHDLRPLWVSWFNRTVKVGRGLPMQGVVASLDLDNDLSIHGIGLSSGAAKAAEWRFSPELGESIHIYPYFPKEAFGWYYYFPK